MPKRKKKKGIVFQISLEVYPIYVLVSIGQTDKQFKDVILPKYWKKFGKLGPHADGHAGQFPGGNCMIRMKHFPNTPRRTSILSHEVFHTVCSVMRFIGMELNRGSEEAYAYLTDFILKKIYKALKRHEACAGNSKT